MPRPLLLATLGLAAAVLLAACSSDEGSADSDPQALLEKTFGSDGDVSSGSLDASLEASASGPDGGSISATLTGPFESRGESEFPLIDLRVVLEVDGKTSFDGGVTVTEDAAYVSIDGRDYAVDEATFMALSGLYAQSVEAQQQEGEDGTAIFEQLGISPPDWLIDVTNEGTEEIGGADTVHISGTADIARIVEDAEALGSQAGAAGFDPAVTSELAKAVETAGVDVYTGTKDALLRRLDLALELKEPGGSETIAVALSIGINGLNEPQDFVAPENPRPLDELVPGGLGALGGIGGELPAPDGGLGGQLPGASPEYVDCLATANTPEEITDCASLL